MSSLLGFCPVATASRSPLLSNGHRKVHYLSSASHFHLHLNRPFASYQISSISSVSSCTFGYDLGHRQTFHESFTALPRPLQIQPSVRTQRKPVCSAASNVAGKSSDSPDYRQKANEDIRVLVVGSTGYIGKFVTKELIKRGFHVIAVAREKSGIGGKASSDQVVADMAGAEVLFSDVTQEADLRAALGDTPVDVVVSCLASRTGGKKKPLLEFQRAKLKLEADLEADPDITHSIVRPTAFFKSLGGQVESVKNGGPYVMFGDGQLCACKPISEADLASYMADCITDGDKRNQVLPIGGPTEALTPLQQGELLFKIVGKKPKFIKVPIQIMDFVIGILDNLAKVFPNLEDAAEFGKIGRYYAAESMLVYDPVTDRYDAEATPGYGKDTLQGFFERVVREGMGGQELGDQAVFK